MGSAAVAQHALSCSRYGGCLAETPSTSNSKRVLFQRTGLLAMPCQKRHPLPSCRHSQRSGRACATRAGYALMESSPSIDVEGIVAEAPSLLALSSDLDWERSVSELREEALEGLSAGEMAMERLGGFIDAWLHDRVVASVLLQPSLQLRRVPDLQEELGVRIRVEDLRGQAALQATEELANGVDGSFDWESEVAELRQCLVNQERVDREQKLWNSWESAREGMDEDAESLHDEAFKLQQSDGSYLTLSPDEESREDPMEHENLSLNQALGSSGTWWTLGVVATAGLFGSHQNMDAIAADVSVTSAVTAATSAATAATSETPGWVAPSVLAFPVASYFLFTLYRNKVNPYAKLTDWVFGLVAMAILGNIVLIATVGVRLY